MTLTNFLLINLSVFTYLVSCDFHCDRQILSKYQESDKLLAQKLQGTNQVVFIGDSITENWDSIATNEKKGYINRGVCGEVTRQILYRFQADVVELKPKVVVIHAGRNDLKANINIKNIESNLRSMAQSASSHGIRVILTSVTPVCGINLLRKSLQNIEELNQWIEDYAKNKGFTFVDYYSLLADTDGILKEEYSFDCLHISNKGYDVLTPVIEKAVRKELIKDWWKNLLYENHSETLGISLISLSAGLAILLLYKMISHFLSKNKVKYASLDYPTEETQV